MAMTITELQAFIDEKPDVRSIVNEIADYLQATPPGAGFPSSISEDTTVDLNGHEFEFTTPSDDPENPHQLLYFDPDNFNTYLFSNYGQAQGSLTMNSSTDDANLNLTVSNGANTVGIIMTANDGDGNTITYQSDTHTFPIFAGGGTTGASIDDDGKLIRTP